MTDPKYVLVGDPEEGEVCLEEIEMEEEDDFSKS